MTLTLRRAKNSDAALLFRLRTEAITRVYSIVDYPSNWSQHLQSLTTELLTPDHIVFIAEEKGRPVGSITMDLAREGAIELTWIIAAECRQQGIGKRMVKEAKRMADAPVSARIKSDDKISLKIAKRVGLKAVSEEDNIKYFRTAAEAEVLQIRPKVFAEKVDTA